MIKFEVATGCNLKCPRCVDFKKLHYMPDQKWIRFDAYEKIHKKISKAALRISYFMFGEPLVNPDLVKIIKRASGDNIYTYFCSNITLADEKKVEDLVDAGLGEVSIPLDGWTQEEYGKYRIDGEVEKVKKAIHHFMAFKGQKGSKWPIIKVNTITFKHISVESMNKIKDFCDSEKVDNYVVKPNLDEVPCMSEKKPFSSCFWPWYSMFIDTDGSVYPCIGLQRKGKVNYGNLLEDSFDDVWNGKEYVRLREFLGAKNKGHEKYADIPCHTCVRYGEERLTYYSPEEGLTENVDFKVKYS